MKTYSWSPLRTIEYLPFKLHFYSAALKVIVPGYAPVAPVAYLADLQVQRGGIFYSNSRGGYTLKSIEMLALRPWKGSGVPDVQIHPVALLHLLCSGQVTKQDVFRFNHPNMNPAVRRTIRRTISEDCPLLEQLQVSRARLWLSTIFEVTVVANA